MIADEIFLDLGPYGGGHVTKIYVQKTIIPLITCVLLCKAALRW